MNHITKGKEVKSLQEILNQEKSIYLQIKEMIERDILRDILLEEERVPSTNELAKLYAINPATAAKGINLLVEEGILYKKRGIGMFVAEGAKAAIMKKRRTFLNTNAVKSRVAGNVDNVDKKVSEDLIVWQTEILRYRKKRNGKKVESLENFPRHYFIPLQE